MNSPQTVSITARALLLSYRIDPARLEQSDLLATNPLTFPGRNERRNGGRVSLRGGWIGTTAAEQEAVLQNVRRHITGGIKRKEEEAPQDRALRRQGGANRPGGPTYLERNARTRDSIAEALAKSVVRHAMRTKLPADSI